MKKLKYIFYRNCLKMRYIISLIVIFVIMVCFVIGCYQLLCGIFEMYQYVFRIGQYDCECELFRVGQMKFVEGKVYVCDGIEWKVLQYEVLLGFRSDFGFLCKDIKVYLKDVINDIYWIILMGNF